MRPEGTLAHLERSFLVHASLANPAALTGWRNADVVVGTLPEGIRSPMSLPLPAEAGEEPALPIIQADRA